MKLLILLLFMTAHFVCFVLNIMTSCEEAVDLIRELRKIHTPDGIEPIKQVLLHGEKKWITIRG